MEIKESDIADDTSVYSIQNNVKINVENEKSTVLNDPLYELIEKQAKEFKVLGKQMSLDLRDIYKEHLNQDEEVIKLEKESKSDYESKEQIIVQEQLIDSLRARIEELETDSMIKNQDIKKLRQDFVDFKKEFQFILDKQPVQAQSIKDSVPSINNLEIVNQIDGSLTAAIGSCAISSHTEILKNEGKEKSNNKKSLNVLHSDHGVYSFNHENLDEPSSSYHQYDEKPVEPSTLYHQYDEEPVEPPTVYRQYDEPVEPSTFYHQYDEEPVEPSTFYHQYQYEPVEPSTFYHQYDEEPVKPSIDYHQHDKEPVKRQYEPVEPSTTYQRYDFGRYFDKYNKTESSVSQQYNNEENYFDDNHSDKFTFKPKLSSGIAQFASTSFQPKKNETKSQQKSKQTQVLTNNSKVHAKVMETIEKFKNKKLLDTTFNDLMFEFPTKRLLKYEKSKEFESLSKNQKRCIKFTVNEMLRKELSQEEKKLSLPVKVYTARGVLPGLPDGIKSYTEFQNTDKYRLLSDVKKKRINKVALVEQRH
ncbi:1980_t:CDS:1 [Funneliformis geosporum]|uniref:1885_t:CDS:1 n=1 Tax=Funneliformis geosporum TaxID=1117311 RepID=A0A9W4SJD5_9GLOM|nr:1980_t:CDS:1 [Funneliformis geosporum]CAI2171656.1 1885_t:CDS:1 [Funneliformis geosporum]